MSSRPDFLAELRHRAQNEISQRTGLVPPHIQVVETQPPGAEPKIEIIPDSKPTETIEITWGQLATPEELGKLIKIIEDDAERVSSDGVIDMTDIRQIIEQYGPEVGPKVIISAATNLRTGAAFCERLRKNLAHLNPSDRTTGEKDDFNQIDLIRLSEKWQIPLVLVRLGGDSRFGHFTLALKNPERTDSGQWRVLIYDPLANGERWQNLPSNWQTSFSELAVLSNGVVDKEGEYDLTVEGDEEIANSFEIIRAKLARFQFDSYNCGPLCLYAAALRLAFKPGWNGFKFSGRDTLEEDTRTTSTDGEVLPGIRIYTRDEVFDKELLPGRK